ncbi:MAG: hypothetical protein Q8J78_01485 [Moraxellaceae bacterium]|nr:hypothetical protein [Moraxellaceae bacterium]
MKIKILSFAISVVMLQPTYALEALDEDVLRAVSAQDGLLASLQGSELTLNRFQWEDDNLALRVNQIRLAPLDVTLDFDVGANAGVPAFSMGVTIEPYELSSVAMRVAGAGGSTRTFGLLGIETLSPTIFRLSNTNGLFDASTSNGKLFLDARDGNWYLAQPRLVPFAGGFNGDPAQGYNVLVFRNFNLVGEATGKFTLDSAKGLNFLGNLSLPRVNTTTNGFQLDLGVQTNIMFPGSPAAFDFGVLNASNTQSHWKFGFSGDLLNVDYSVRGSTGAGIGTGLGSSGIILQPKFEFARQGEGDQFVLELAEPGGNSLRFSNWRALVDGASATPSRATFDMGSIYINLLEPGALNGLSNFTTSTTSSFFPAAAFGATPASVIADENSVAIAVRGFELQGGARTITMHDVATGTQLSTPQTWALMPNFYNLDANLLLYPSGHPSIAAAERHGAGFDLTIQTAGKNTAYGTPSTEGSHLIVADTDANKYIGFRNIDARYSFLAGQLYVADTSMDYLAGSGLDVNGLRFASRNMSFDIRADLAIGDLPDGTVARRMRDDDAIAGMRWKFGGDFSFTLAPPPGQDYIGITSVLRATDPSKNGLYIIEPVDGTRIEWIDITGELRLVSQHVMDADVSDASRIDFWRESVASQPGPVQRTVITFATAYELGPGTGRDDVVRIGKLNLYKAPATNAAFTGAGNTYREGVDWKPGAELNGVAAGSGTAFTLGQMVIPGGKFYGQVDLKVK